MVSSIVLPATYRQILNAAADYNSGSKYNDAYRAVYEGDFRRNHVERGNETDMRELTHFLNKWRCHLSRSRTPAILKVSVPQAAFYLKPLSGVLLGDERVNCASFRAVELAFNRLIEDKGIAAAVASKILGVLNPEFFVAWDNPIQKAIYGNRKCYGQHYAAFMRDMHESARTILADGRKHGIENPAVSISQAINQHPPFTLAHFINNYVWLTVTLGYNYSPGPPTD